MSWYHFARFGMIFQYEVRERFWPQHDWHIVAFYCAEWHRRRKNVYTVAQLVDAGSIPDGAIGIFLLLTLTCRIMAMGRFSL
jgi:hypothetical protein